MKIAGQHILITGASGGIGAELALALASKGAVLLLADLNESALEALRLKIAAAGGTASAAGVDLSNPAAVEKLAAAAQQTLNHVDILINVAGLLSFKPFEDETPEGIARLWQVNVLAPMLLARALLPSMRARGSGHIVNIGSTFGSIGFPFFASYSASKFALRGFSQALRRELAGSGVGVTYIAPRFTRTPLNAGASNRMAEALKMNRDDPAWVAGRIVRAIEKDAKEHYIGFPECFFARLNGILPGLVDGALEKQTPQMREFAANP